MLILPPAPSLAITMLGTLWPGVKLRFEANGRGAPVGHTVAKLGALGFGTVTFRATAVALPGTLESPLAPVRPVIWTSMAWPCPTAVPPKPERVSSRRSGLRGVNVAPWLEK